MQKKLDRIFAASLIIMVSLCALVGLVGVISLLTIVQNNPSMDSLLSTNTVTHPTPEFPTPEPTATSTPRPTPQPVEAGALDTLETLNSVVVPSNSPEQLVQEFLGVVDPRTSSDTVPPVYQVGSSQQFWLLDDDTNTYFQVTAILRAVRPDVYFYIEDGVSYDEESLNALVDAFQNEIIPTNREFFGSEWTPGVDNDPHLYILYAGGIGSSVGGYYGTNDELMPEVDPHSNVHELFVINSDNSYLEESYTFGTLAHEFQHMIHWFRDRNEAGWLNEGFSELATLLNGYDPGGFDRYYIQDPDMQLNDWPEDTADAIANYGASFIFTTYFLDRFGEEVTQALVNEEQNGLASIDLILSEQGITDLLTGQTITADDVYRDWTVTNFLNDGSIGDGRYQYVSYPGASRISRITQINCGDQILETTVHQYGADYYRLNCSGPFTLNFSGNTSTDVVPADPHSGSYMFWSNKGDYSTMRLSQTFDLTTVSGPQVTFTYWTWYNLETDYDYVYLQASVDGDHWDMLTPPSCVTTNPAGNNYGCGYNDQSAGWIQETVDLSAYAGQQVTLQFVYVTDPAVNGEGLLLDDMAIPEIGYSTDFEDGDGGWTAEGFVRIENLIPQTFLLTLVSRGTETTVQSIEIGADNTVTIPLDGGSGEYFLIISGTTRYTRIAAEYSIWMQPQ
ncbi:MAG TPA: hypothetical protein VN376_08275 [Longilinea sp.]|nr:hypothetical protein [Longilinea sp.]